MAGLRTKLEQHPITAVTANIAPVDVLFENYNNGDHLAVDVIVISSFRWDWIILQQQLTCLLVIKHIWINWINIKMLHSNEEFSFKPIVVEEFGAVHKEAMRIFNRLCEFISICQNKPLTQIKFKYSKLLSCDFISF